MRHSHLPHMRSKGHSLETFPKEMAAVRDAGHEMFVLRALQFALLTTRV